jgi:hypothetical protein
MMKFLTLVPVTLSVITFTCTATPVLRRHAPKDSSPTVSLPQAIVKGFTDASGNSVFLGIPFADTTGGNNRYVVLLLHELLTYLIHLLTF